MEGRLNNGVSVAEHDASRRRFFLPALLSVLLTAVSPSVLHAQHHASIRGIILDAESGQPVADTYLFLHPKDKPAEGRQESVGEDGTFLFSRLSPGMYVLSITHTGYKMQIMEVSLPATEERDVIMYLQPRTYATAPVVVTGTHRHSRVETGDERMSVLQGRELEKELGLTLAATLKNETGIAMRAMGPAPARPVIRGLGGDRVVLSEDGSRTTDLSATSPDHAVTIEPFAVERIEVLRGPQVLTRSPGTLGGIVNVVRHEIPQERHDNIVGTAGVYGESANGGLLASVQAEAPLKPLMLRAELTRRAAGDVRTPEGTLENSSARSLDYSFGASHIFGHGYAGASYRDYSLAYGVPGGFVGAHPQGVDIELERRQINLRGMYAIDASLLHDIRFHFKRAWYRHKEFEASGLIGSEFRIIGYAGDVQAMHHSFGPVTDGVVGIDLEHRDFNVGGYVFTVPSTSTMIAPYIFERMRFGRLSAEAAMRYTWNRIVPVEEKPDARIGHIRERRFDALSLSATLRYALTDIVHVGFNISRSNRMPTVEELYSEGPHLAAYSYEVGNPELGMERGTGLEAFLYHRFEQLSFNVNVFHNKLTSFITPRNTGEINYATFLPIYATEGVPAIFSGAEAQVEWDVLPTLRLDASLSYTRGSFSDDGSPLPQIPPLKGGLGATARLGAWRVGMEAILAARQDRVDTYEEMTAGYVILNASMQYSVATGRQVHNLSLVVDNITNRAYRNHLSRVKAILPEAGINARVTYKLYFDF